MVSYAVRAPKALSRNVTWDFCGGPNVSAVYYRRAFTRPGSQNYFLNRMRRVVGAGDWILLDVCASHVSHWMELNRAKAEAGDALARAASVSQNQANERRAEPSFAAKTS